ncbi:MAG: AAA family ATPase [Acidobacteriota bacterium]|nr:AAA family ATPase [Blastocatellia bacterium]MDW8413326.1 AAA family ATPase [Acidobacteriota bacterium]
MDSGATKEKLDRKNLLQSTLLQLTQTVGQTLTSVELEVILRDVDRVSYWTKRLLDREAFLGQLAKLSVYIAAVLSVLLGRIWLNGSNDWLLRSALHKLRAPLDLRAEVLALIKSLRQPFKLVKLAESGMTEQEARLLYRKLAARVDLRLLELLVRARCCLKKKHLRAEVLGLLERFKSTAQRFGLWEGRFKGLLSDDKLSKLVGLNEREVRRLRRHLLLETLGGRLETTEAAIDYLSKHKELLLERSTHLYLTCGVPGAGKSTWLSQNLNGVQIVSSDNKRLELFGDETFQGDNEKVFTECRIDVERFLSAGNKVAVDATNILRAHRANFLRLAASVGAHTTVVYFDLPLEAAIERNAKRSRQVPESDIKECFEKLQEPDELEVDEVLRVDNSAVGDELEGWTWR